MRSVPSPWTRFALGLFVVVGCRAATPEAGEVRPHEVEAPTPSELRTSYARGMELLGRGEPQQLLDLLAGLEGSGLALDDDFLRLREEARLLRAFELGELDPAELGILLVGSTSPALDGAPRELSDPDECGCSYCGPQPVRR